MICTIGDFIFESTKNKTEKKKNQELAEELMKLHQEYHDYLSQDPYATQGSILCCTYGTKLTSLDTTATADVCDIGTRLPILGCNACEVGKNIYSFYGCRAPESSDLPMREILAGGYRKCVPLLNGEWKQANDKTPLLWNSTTDECSYALKDKALIVCKYKGIIGVIELPEEKSEVIGNELITMAQMSAFKFQTTESELKELNKALNDYNITDKSSIALFMATCGHESGKGLYKMEEGDEAYFKSNGYSSDTRGAGYLQVTGDDQLLFYESINKTPPINRAKDIADNYAWAASAWEWAIDRKGENVVMNSYVESYGNGENIFLVTQYFINSYLNKKDYPYFNSDLSDIRKGVSYSYDFNKTWTSKEGETFTGVLNINGRSYRLPLNHQDRLANYQEAIQIFK